MTSIQLSGTTTFLFTDIESSSKLWEQHPQAMRSALAQHDAILRAAVENNYGRIIKTTGDGVHAGFSNALNAVNACLMAQQQLAAPLGDLWLKVRMGLHSGEAEERAGDYYGTAINRAARLMAVANGGQVLISNAAAELTRDQLPSGASLRDLGLHRLKDLTRPEHVFQLTHPMLTDDFPPLRSLDAFPNNLPIQLTSFIGRETEIADIRALLKTSKLVTLTGSGGTGKTRLSMEVGAQELADYSHGVWLIELAPLADPSQIIPAIAHTFGLQELPFSPLAGQVIDYLRDKQLLLLLDNCEHLIEACARLSDDLLHQCSRLKIIASSRESLGISGEMAYRIPSLAGDESTRLFVERAGAANSKFYITNANEAAIAKICSRLDGIPLAIELAAARCRLLTPEQIAARLDDRFRLLVGGSRTALPRQQTLRALIDWSYDLLSEDEKCLLWTSSVFIGGWSLEALESISDSTNVIDDLEQLVNKSLVTAEERGTEMRYFMLETIRQYALEKLLDSGQSAQVRDRHFAYFNDFSGMLWEMFRSTDSLAWRGKTDDEFENMRVAIEWGMRQHAEEVLHLAANFCFMSGSLVNATEALDLLNSALVQVRSLAPVDGEAGLRRQKLIASALFAQGMVGMGGEGYPQVRQSFQEAISISRLTGDKIILGYSLEMYYIASLFNMGLNEPASAEEGLAVLSEIDDRWGLGMAYMNMVRVASMRGDQEAKQKYMAIVKERLQDTPLAIQSGMFYLVMGFDERRLGNDDSAKQYFETGLVIFRRLRNKIFEYVLLSELGHIARVKGNFTQAREIYEQTITGWQKLGARPAIAHQLECFAILAVQEEEPQLAVKLLGSAEALREKVQSPMADHEQAEYDLVTAQLRSMLDTAEFAMLWVEGRALTIEQAVQLALA